MAATAIMDRPAGSTRLAAVDWPAVHAALDDQGWATLPGLLDGGGCAEVAGWYDQPALFRSHVVMARHGFGRGEYRYFAAPLPPLIALLRRELYRGLVPLARRWAERTGRPADFPATHDGFLTQCHAAGQTRPTPLLLRYGAGDYNCLHQDLYGELAFPIQMAVLLSPPAEPGANAGFEGGEFVLVEQRPRAQSRAEVVALRQGDAVCFAVHDRPVRGTRGDYRIKMRHGVSRIRRGERLTLGIILHDAR